MEQQECKQVDLYVSMTLLCKLFYWCQLLTDLNVYKVSSKVLKDSHSDDHRRDKSLMYVYIQSDCVHIHIV